MTVVHSVLPVSKVKTISRGFMSGSDSSPLCAPVDKIKIISRGFMSGSDSSPFCTPVSKVKIISEGVCVWEGVMSGSDSSPLCAPVNKIKIISRVFRSECDTDSSALCAPVNKIKIILGARINVQATSIYSICKGFWISVLYMTLYVPFVVFVTPSQSL